MASLRMTLPTQLVLRALTEDPEREMYGLEICGAVGLPSGTVHPILARLQKAGWLESRWEDVDVVEQGRPRRRYYGVNRQHMAAITAALTKAEASAHALARLRPRIAVTPDAYAR